MKPAPMDAVIALEETAPAQADLLRLHQAIQRTQDFLLQRQAPAGYWLGKLEADASVSAGYIPLMYFMNGRVDPLRQAKAVRKVTSQQNPDGSWSAYTAGPGDLNVSIQCYFALKLAGAPADEPAMQRARDFILACGGIDRANVFTKVWLALFGQYDWQDAPSIPPEIIFLPNWFYFHIYEFASWSRATIMALIVVLSTQPVCAVPESASLAELYVQPREPRASRVGKIDRLWSWKGFFLLADRFFKTWERLPFQPRRRQALRRVEKWIVEHQEADGSWGGIMLPWIYSLMALKSLGYPPDHPVIARGMAGLEDFIIEDEDTLLLQPSVSPIWDTAWASLALREAGLPEDHPALQKAAQWLLQKEIRHPGDWRVKNPRTEPGGWAFEFENNWYPDLDDSAVAPRALLQVRLPAEQEPGKAQAVERALRWVCDMQSKDGGWGAFDRDNDKTFLTHVPFADFMSPLDPTCADVTAHVVEFLSAYRPDHPALASGLAYLQSVQEMDGAWYGRWGVNYLYGTGLTLAGLIAAGQDPRQVYIQRAVAWLVSRQNADGGWGETCETYADPSLRGRGPSTASQTAWVLIGLLAAEGVAHPAVQKGIEYLLRNQQPEGAWEEVFYTGAGFPKIFYLHYDMYRVYFPLIALARCQAGSEKALKGASHD